mgnify:CR=1 FL=1
MVNIFGAVEHKGKKTASETIKIENHYEEKTKSEVRKTVLRNGKKTKNVGACSRHIECHRLDHHFALRTGDHL